MASQRYRVVTYNPFRRTMALLGILGLTSCAWVYSMLDIEPDREDTFKYVCYKLEQMYGVSCGSLDAPIVVFSDIIIDAAGYGGGWYGVYYHGEKYVFINPTAPEDMWIEIILHETGHYVIHELGLPPDGDSCEGERVVREISGGPWDDAAKVSYGCNK